MRPREAVVLLLIAALAGAGCSRVAMFKTDPSRKGFDRVSEPVIVQDTAASRDRDTARLAVDRSQQKLIEGDLDTAEAQANKALKADPKSGDAYTLLAVIADRRGRSSDAGAHYLRAAELEPSGPTLNNYGTWLCSNGRATESLAWFDKALQDPAYRSRTSAMANAGKCTLDAGRPIDAEKILRATLQQDPNDPVALGAMASIAFRAGNYMEARAFSERRLAAASATPEALQLASQIEDKLGDSAAAARYVRRLREEFPGVAQGNAGGSKAP
jgi:type IV pilus assembly protein PilF